MVPGAAAEGSSGAALGQSFAQGCVPKTESAGQGCCGTASDLSHGQGHLQKRLADGQESDCRQQ